MTERDWLIECVDLIERQGIASQVAPVRSVNMTTRWDGVERTYEADFVKYLMRGLPELKRLLADDTARRALAGGAS